MMVVTSGAALCVSGCYAGADEAAEDLRAAQAGEAGPSGDLANDVMRPGLYAVGDGTQIYSRTRLSEDGTYTDLNDALEKVGGGTWEARDGMMCFDPEGDGEDQQERCWTNGEPDEDRSFLTTRIDSEESYRVTPLNE